MATFRQICGLILFASSLTAAAQEEFTLEDIVQSTEAWAKENLDEEWLRALSEADQQQVAELLEQLQKRFQGEYIVDLAPLKEAARTVLPLLATCEETSPYAAWLKTRLDYFDIADQLRVLVPPPQPKPGELPKPAAIPASRVREVWTRRLVDRPVPEQAKPYLTQLKSIFAAESVPPELVWVAEVESSFDPRVRSPAGAAGLFQLMPATARQYGLRTWPLDQRTKAEPNARAAAQHLKRLRARYPDWRLTLAAYNAGEGTVDKLLARQKARSFDAIAPWLPAETQLYVPKVDATLKRREGKTLSELPAVLSTEKPKE